MGILNIITVFLVLFGVSSVSSLECYVCNEQEDNDGKCVKTVQQCKRGEEHCLSYIKWGSMPYWTQGAPKQYFISKMCSTKQKCEEMKTTTLPRCERIGYNDWECSECCQGDRCNYFITLAGSVPRSSWTIITLGVLLVVGLWFSK